MLKKDSHTFFLCSLYCPQVGLLGKLCVGTFLQWLSWEESCKQNTLDNEINIFFWVTDITDLHI